MKNILRALPILVVLVHATLTSAQDAAPPDRNAVNTAARPGDMLADSPVTFPKVGALPAKYPPDVNAPAEPAEKDYFIFATPCRSLAQIAAIQKDMPAGQFTPPCADWTRLRRTQRILTAGGDLRLLALGDSIVNDTMRSGWVAQLQAAYPQARIQATVYVRGGGGCQHYREEDRVAKYIVPRKPDLVYIGGISQKNIESIREVIRQLRAALPEVDILLATGTFGTTDPRDAAALAHAPHSGTGPYGRALTALAAEQRCAYLDMTGPWAEYIRSAKVHPHLFYRDVVHANESGEQILAKIMMAFWIAPDRPPVAEVVPLEGMWQVEEGVAPDEVPAAFTHEVPVPGLTRQARPAFPDVDHYETHEFVWTMKHYGVFPASEVCPGSARTRQQRKFFWYAKTFHAPAAREHATLVVNKAQFGTAVWLNGRKLGEHAGCFTAGRFDATAAVKWEAENRLVIRIGAHPGAMPEGAFWGSDGEKGPWTPGIYDGVELRLANNPVIEDLQVAPRIGSSEIIVQTRLKNYGAARTVELAQRVRRWNDQREVGSPVCQAVELAAGEEKTLEQTVPVPDAVHWTPDNPFLYQLETGTNGDLRATRFGMRELRFDPAARVAMLNGQVCYLRGASLTFHRFLGDPKCGSLPWDEAWVRKLLVDIPHRMNWNAFRLCIGPVPQRWLDVADEAGLMLQNEFPIWSDRPAEPSGKKRHESWREAEIEEQAREFLRDNWNHPSVVIWDISNETHWDFLRARLIPALRSLDLSGRPWENGYLPPQDAGDPYETHPYKFADHVFGKQPPFFQMPDLERGPKEKPPTDWRARHASLINEYDWLWLHRDGTPTHLTRKVYDHLLGPDATPQARLALSGYLLGGLTEYWRAQRQHAGVMYLAYLDGDLPHAFTCDNFRNIETLELEPHFEDHMREAFKPLGVYVDFWQPTLPPGIKRSYRVTLVNDTHEPARGRLRLAWLPESGKVEDADAGAEQAVEVAPCGRASYDIELAAPTAKGRYVLKATASWPGKPWSPTLSRRRVFVTNAVSVR